MNSPIDWKAVAQSEGYIYFKKQYISTTIRHGRSKAESYREFQRIIGLAKNRASHHDALTGTDALIDVLNLFKSQCDYWYFNFRPEKAYHQKRSQPGLRATLNYFKSDPWLRHHKRKGSCRSLSEIIRHQKKNASPKNKTRWKNDPFKQHKWERQQRIKKSL